VSTLFTSSSAAWAALLIVFLPLLIIGSGEVEERLRQRDSEFRGAVSIIRVWVVPLLTLWLLTRALFDTDGENPFLRLLSSGLLISAAAATLAALRVVVSRLVDRPKTSNRPSVPRLLLALPRILVIFTTAWFLIAGVWGVDLSSALAAAGVTSLIISFALQDTLSGIASGFTLLADQPFSPGDWIETDTVAGRVIDVNWRATRIQDRNGDLITVPNGQLATATITNYDQPSRLHRVIVPVQIERTAPPTAAKEMLVDAALSTPGVLEDPAPYARVTQIADPVVDYEAHMWIDDYAIAPQVKADFGALVWYLSYRHDVPLPNPAQDLYLFDGERTAIESRVTSAQIRRRISDSPLVAELEDEVLDQLAAGASLSQYQRGETIFGRGERRVLQLVVDGRARLVLRGGDGTDVDVLDIEAGEVVGVLDELPDMDREALVIAITDCDVVTVTAESASRAVLLAPDLATVLEQLAVSRRRRIERVLRRVENS